MPHGIVQETNGEIISQRTRRVAATQSTTLPKDCLFQFWNASLSVANTYHVNLLENRTRGIYVFLVSTRPTLHLFAVFNILLLTWAYFYLCFSISSMSPTCLLYVVHNRV